MSKLLESHEMKENVSESCQCPYCLAIFAIKAEDIVRISNIAFAAEGEVKCPNCTNMLKISERDVSNKIVKVAFLSQQKSILK